MLTCIIIYYFFNHVIVSPVIVCKCVHHCDRKKKAIRAAEAKMTIYVEFEIGAWQLLLTTIFPVWCQKQNWPLCTVHVIVVNAQHLLPIMTNKISSLVTEAEMTLHIGKISKVVHGICINSTQKKFFSYLVLTIK